jgi:hypothetical protein
MLSDEIKASVFFNMDATLKVLKINHARISNK